MIGVLVLCLALAAGVSAQPSSDLRVDTRSIDAFWPIFDALTQDREPTETQWKAALSTDAYRYYVDVERKEQLYRKAWPLAFMPSRAAELKGVAEKDPVIGFYAAFYAGIGGKVAELKGLASALSTPAVLSRVKAMASEWAPAEARQLKQWPSIALVFSDPDGTSYESLLIVDLQFLLMMDPAIREKFLAHELHHTFTRSVSRLRTDLDKKAPEWPLIHAIDQIRFEGTADMIDKAALLATSMPMASRLRDEMAKNDAVLADMDRRLTAIDADPSTMGEHAKAIWNGLPFAGHPMGYTMAQTIVKEQGRSGLFACLANPFQFLRAYNDAARAATSKDKASRPLFSAASLRVIATLEKTALR